MHQDVCWSSSLKVIQNTAWRVKLYFVRCVEINFMWVISTETTLKRKCPCDSKKTVKYLKTKLWHWKVKLFWRQCFVLLFFVIFLKQLWMQTYFALTWTASVSEFYWRTVVTICPTRIVTKEDTWMWISVQFGGLCFWILELFYLSNYAINCLASNDWMICYINFDIEMKQQIELFLHLPFARDAKG